MCMYCGIIITGVFLFFFYFFVFVFFFFFAGPNIFLKVCVGDELYKVVM